MCQLGKPLRSFTRDSCFWVKRLRAACLFFLYNQPIESTLLYVNAPIRGLLGKSSPTDIGILYVAFFISSPDHYATK